jgi:hypothetical protein
MVLRPAHRRKPLLVAWLDGGASRSGSDRPAVELSASLGAFLAGLYVGNTTERALVVRAMGLLVMPLLPQSLSNGLERALQFAHRGPGEPPAPAAMAERARDAGEPP